eukprot:3410833-Prymnesium_polylepis.1
MLRRPILCSLWWRSFWATARRCACMRCCCCCCCCCMRCCCCCSSFCESFTWPSCTWPPSHETLCSRASICVAARVSICDGRSCDTADSMRLSGPLRSSERLAFSAVSSARSRASVAASLSLIHI